MNLRLSSGVFCLSALLLASCGSQPQKNHGPIKLGDPSTVVTETDPSKLQDLVVDVHPTLTPIAETPKPKDTAKNTATPAVDTTHKTAQTATPPPPAPAQTVPNGPGLKAEFKETTFFIGGLNAKISGNGNLMNANGAVYTLNSGNIPGNSVHVTGNVTKVSQRYQSIVMLKGKNGNLRLDDLTETTNWKQVNGSNGAYTITGMGDNELNVIDADGSDLKKAVQKACRSRHLSGKKMQEWMNLLGNAKAPNQKPCFITLRSAMWKVDGKDASGKIFSKQIRIDIPL